MCRFFFYYNHFTPRHQGLTVTTDDIPLSPSPMSICSWGGTTPPMPEPTTTDNANANNGQRQRQQRTTPTPTPIPTPIPAPTTMDTNDDTTPAPALNDGQRSADTANAGPAPLPRFKCKTEGINFFHFIFYFIIYMLTRRHLALRGALSTLEYMYIHSLDRL